MKTRLTTLDIVTLVKELRKKLIGLRVDQVYDVDRKTYLIRLTKTDVKKMLLIESASRFHTTNFEWPKNPAPSGFTMKLRKHLKNKRIECINQVGADRIVHFQFGAAEFAFHLYLELYDKGNIILTDYSYNILTLVRPHVQGEDKFAAHEKYTTDKAKTQFSLEKLEMISLIMDNPGKTIREIFLSKIEFGPALFTHVLKIQGLTLQTKLPTLEEPRKELEEKLFIGLEQGRCILECDEIQDGGFITYTTSFTTTKPFDSENKTMVIKKNEPVILYDQFNPIVLISNYDENNCIKFPTLDDALDDFYSKIESQKLDMKQVTQEREAFKKLDRVKEDQVKRLNELKSVQEIDKKKAELIMFNQELIEQTIAIIRQLIANQIPWDGIWLQIKDAQDKGDTLAQSIVKLELFKTQFTMSLSDPYGPNEDSLVEVDIDLDLSAYANASKYFDLKKASAKKEERTLQSQEKAFKSTEKKTINTLREVAMIQQIKKARKVFWFEKFHWFISSENYLILGGHDAQQNELLVKRYMNSKDIYIHADAHGAPTFIIKNDNTTTTTTTTSVNTTGNIMEETMMVPPKTLNEACCLAVSYSGSWESKIIASAWWVWGDQVSKSAPTGEYLPTGSFMIRGKKNYLPPCQLVLGFGFLFRISEDSIPRHEGERAKKIHEDEEIKEISYTPISTQDDKIIIKKEENDETKEVGDEEEEVETTGIGHEEEEEEAKGKGHEEEEEEEEEGKVGKNVLELNDGEEIDEYPDTNIDLDLRLEEVKEGNIGGRDGNNSSRTRTRTISTQSTTSSQHTFQLEEEESSPPLDIEIENKSFIINSGLRPNFESSVLKNIKSSKKKEQKRGGDRKKIKPIPIIEEIQQQNKESINNPIIGNNNTKSKRGQHGRQKKIKEKYKDQDDEERELRMQLLQSAGKFIKDKQQQQPPPPPTTTTPPVGLTTEQKNSFPQSLSIFQKPKFQYQQKQQQQQKLNEIDENPDGGGQELETNVNLDLLNCLTGCPIEEDELLFAIPVVAPYTTLQNYKFRIKMLPGTTKRGKAARSALEIFIRDKSIKQREKDLLKSVKDQDLARNFPGKVKLSTGANDKK